MKKFVLVCLLLFGLTALAAPVRSMVGARNTVNAETPERWVNPYVTDGLIAMWDGEWNAGIGIHDSESTIWKDLAGNNDATITAPAVFGTNYMQSAKSCGSMQMYYASKSIRTIDVVVQNVKDGYVWGMTSNRGRGLVCIANNGWHTFNNGNANDVVVECNIKDVNHITITKTNEWLTTECYLNGNIYTGTTKYNDWWYVGFGFGGSLNAGSVTKFYSARLYSRKLTPEEVRHNHDIDKERFNLP